MDHKLELWQAGVMVAEVDGPDIDQVHREIMHYAMVYSQDGKVEIKGRSAKALFDKIRRDGK